MVARARAVEYATQQRPMRQRLEKARERVRTSLTRKLELHWREGAVALAQLARCDIAACVVGAHRKGKVHFATQRAHEVLVQVVAVKGMAEPASKGDGHARFGGGGGCAALMERREDGELLERV